MNYDFDTIINRYGTNSIKYDFAHEKGKPEGLLPMWVADMDFLAPPEVLADIQKAVSHGIFGYSEPKDDYYNAVIEWFGSHFGYYTEKNEIITVPGLVFGLAQAVHAFTAPNDAVIIQTPVYPPFYDVVLSNGRKLVTNPLIYDNGKYLIDFEDFERKIKDNDVKLFILCSPHNPVGRVWTREELERMSNICVKYGVIVVSDEIHCDFVWQGHEHICFGLLNENAVVATAPSKTFNLAGLQASNIFVKNEDIRNKLKAEINRSGYSQLNVLGIVACQSAYTKGGAWLGALKAYLTENIRLIQDFLTARLPKIKPVDPQSTYLLWLDFSEYGLTQAELDRKITEGAKLWLNNGTMFGAGGEGFQRINIACPRITLINALEKLEYEFS
ncbi:MAG: pyridoxal phosphate-dependent aminotransferase [Dysgonamonadaceae bacterium]|jgi:cystathionine beta-lyase|nr:pyridoxal phosphate-dependent aminotransferase [Dysgonamonadaceae bacterium]